MGKSKARANCAYSRCGLGLFGHYLLLSMISVFYVPLFGGVVGGAMVLGKLPGRPTNFLIIVGQW